MHNKLKIAYVILVSLVSHICIGQGVTHINVETFIGKPKTVTPSSSSIISTIKPPKYGGIVVSGGSFTYNPPGYACLDTLTIRYQYITGGIKRFNYQSYAFSVNQSFISTSQDFTYTDFNSFVYVPVLDNDYITDTTGNNRNLILTSVTNSNSGSAVVFGDRVLFRPNKDFYGIAYFNYTVCNMEGSNCKTGSASVYVNKDVPPQSDTLSLYTAKDDDIVVITPDVKFIVSALPTYGVLTRVGDNAFNYHPNQGFVGTENINFYNFNNNKIYNVTISVLNKPNVNKYAIPDVFYAAEGASIIIDVLKNDRAVNAYVSDYTNPNRNHGKLTFYNNKFSFTPAPGFSGVAKFKYSLKNYSGIPSSFNVNESTTVDIVVSNYYPDKQSFELSTEVNTQLVLNYTTPISGWVFSIIDTPLFGSLVSDESGLVYTPNDQFIGSDYFMVRYSIGSQYRDIKVHVNVQDGTENCSYSCVWSGDTNSDGIVDIFDIVPTGNYLGKTGGGRAVSTDWIACNSQDWIQPMISDINLKHVDADGNGEVNADDIAAIDMNYGKTHSLTPAKVIDYKAIPLNFDIITKDPKIGDTVQVDVSLGTVDRPIIETNGFVMNFLFDEKIVDYNSLDLYFYPNSWITYNSPSVSLVKKYQVNHLDFGIIRSGDSASGLGNIARMSFILKDSLSSDRNSYFKPIEITEDILDGIVIYRNPAQDIINIRTIDQLHNFVIYSINGEYLISGTSNQVDVSSLITGMYIVKITTDKGVFSKKLEIIK